MRCVGFILCTKLLAHVCFFSHCKASVHQQQDREHRQREQCRPLQQKSEEDQHEGDVLWMPNPRVGANRSQTTPALRVIQNIPRARQQIKAKAEKHVAGDVQRTKVRIALFSQ